MTMKIELDMVKKIDKYHRGRLSNPEKVALFCELHNSDLLSHLDSAWQRGLESLVFSGFIQLVETEIGLWAESTGKVEGSAANYIDTRVKEKE
jgi:hypothetical protein